LSLSLFHSMTVCLYAYPFPSKYGLHALRLCVNSMSTPSPDGSPSHLSSLLLSLLLVEQCQSCTPRRPSAHAPPTSIQSGRQITRCAADATAVLLSSSHVYLFT